MKFLRLSSELLPTSILSTASNLLVLSPSLLTEKQQQNEVPPGSNKLCLCREAAARHKDQCPRVVLGHPTARYLLSDRNCPGGTRACGGQTLRTRTQTHPNFEPDNNLRTFWSNKQKPAESIQQQTPKMSIYSVWLSGLATKFANTLTRSVTFGFDQISTILESQKSSKQKTNHKPEPSENYKLK